MRLHSGAPLWALLALICLCSVSGQPPKCPATCQSQLSNVLFSNDPDVTVPFATITACRRGCYTNGYPYYLYTTTKQCSCYKECSSTVALLGTTQSYIGLASQCSDAVCPTSCSSPATNTYINTPDPTYLSQQPNLASCVKACLPVGQFYSYSTARTCSCYPKCNSTANVPGSTPVQLGILQGCLKAPPKTFRCSVYTDACPNTCVGKSQCVSSTGPDLKPRYQCCCVKGSKPVIKNGRLVRCE